MIEARLVSYAPDGGTCTLNIDGVEYYYARQIIMSESETTASSYEIRSTSLTVLPRADPLFSEMATTVSIVDEAAGEYVVVEQSARVDLGKIAIDPEEWDMLCEAITRMVNACRKP